MQVYPASQLGKLQELAEAVSLRTIAFSRNTAGGIGTLYNPVAALDTPCLRRDVDHLMKVTDVNSPVMQQLNQGLIENADVRVIHAHCFGRRNLACNQAIRTPEDLAGVRIRATPFPIHTAAVEGMGAVAVPVDWSEGPIAPATGAVQGQENPVNVVPNVKLLEAQSHLTLTGHMSDAEVVVMNEDAWQGLSAKGRDAVMEASDATRRKAAAAIRDKAAEETKALKAKGMTVIGEAEGLDLSAFRTPVGKVVDARFGDEYGGLHRRIDALA